MERPGTQLTDLHHPLEDAQMNMTDRSMGPGGPPPVDPDAAMVAAVLEGDPEAYRVLVERNERRIQT